MLYRLSNGPMTGPKVGPFYNLATEKYSETFFQTGAPKN